MINFFLIFIIGVSCESTIPKISPLYWFFESFQSKSLDSWIKSQFEWEESTTKYNGKVVVSPPVGKVVSNLDDYGLLLSESAQYYGLCSPIIPPLDNNRKNLIFQYEVKFERDMSCGGAYLKLLQPMKDHSQFNENTPYHILFGPDFCGDTNQVKFILNYKNPQTNEWELKHHNFPPKIRNDPFTHLYTLKITPENTYEIRIDRELEREGSLFDDLTPSVLPPKLIDDQSHPKPSDWDERDKIPDPVAMKPSDWDEDEPMFIDDPSDHVPEDWLELEPLYIPDTSCSEPEEWNREEDGEWSPSSTLNPKCVNEHGSFHCGKWKPKRIKNPKYRGKWTVEKVMNPKYVGEWEPPQIPNPDFFTDSDAYVLDGGVGAVGIEVWTMTENILFDNILLTWDDDIMEEMMDIWSRKHILELEKTPINIEDNMKSVKSEWREGLTILEQLRQLFLRPYPLIMLCLIVFFTILGLLCCYVCRTRKTRTEEAVERDNNEKDERDMKLMMKEQNEEKDLEHQSLEDEADDDDDDDEMMDEEGEMDGEEMDEYTRRSLILEKKDLDDDDDDEDGELEDGMKYFRRRGDDNESDDNENEVDDVRNDIFSEEDMV